MKRYTIFILAVFSAAVLSGCRKDPDPERIIGQTAASFRLTANDAGNGQAGSMESRISNLQAFRFRNGILKEIFTDVHVTEDGHADLYLKEYAGTVHFLANASGIPALGQMEAGVTTLEEFLALTASDSEMTADGIVMSGSAELRNNVQTAGVALKRSVARIDLISGFEGVQIKDITIRSLTSSGYLTERGAGVPDNAMEADFFRDFTGQDVPETGVLAYVCDQEAGKEIEVKVNVEGSWRILKTVMPAIVRNNVYRLKIYGNGAQSRVEISAHDWMDGQGASSDLVMKGLVDTGNSVLSDGVRVSENRDTVFLPYIGSRSTLVLAAEAGSEVIVRGSAKGVSVETPSGRSLQPVASLEISNTHRYPGTGHEYMYLDIMNGGEFKGRVVLKAESNPVLIEGDIILDDNGICDFGRYIDGEIGRIMLPEGKTIEVSFPDNESEWMKVEQADGNSFRIIGGWKPNDPLADGRTQQASLVITDADGSNSETYLIQRRNWGLPVVNVNGVWWCKYNLRGNVKSFEDQITVTEDPAAGMDLGEYLTGCTDDEFAEIAGSQYQGGKQNALVMVNENGKFRFDGYDTGNKGEFGTIDPTYMAPDGYRIPDYDNFRFFAWGENCNLGYGSNAFNNQLGQRLTYTVMERTVTVDGNLYGPMGYYDFVYDGVHLVLMGFGHQYNAQDIASMSILFATYGRPGKSWGIEGYPRQNGSGNWIKFSSQNTQKTRTIRCVKSPVEYIYE